MRERAYLEQGFRASVGIVRLVKSYGRDRLEAACGRLSDIDARSFTSVNSILKNNLDAKRPAGAADGLAIEHSRRRGIASIKLHWVRWGVSSKTVYGPA